VHPRRLGSLLDQFKKGKISRSEILELLKILPYENLDCALVDHHRFLRQGFPEVIYCPGKTVHQISEIARSILKQKVPLLATRADELIFKTIQKLSSRAQFHPEARTVTVALGKTKKPSGKLTLIVTAGTSDIPVAEEAKVTLELLKNRVHTLYDVGVAGIHRLLDRQELLAKAQVIIAIAGMDGVLPSVIGGLVHVPVIAVPTSNGYGTGMGGVAALLTMLNSCANGIAVMNIDNGFGAACFAHRINLL